MPRPIHFEIHGAEPEALARYYGEVFGWEIEQWGDAEYWHLRTGEDGPGIDGAVMLRAGPAPDAQAPVMGAILAIEVGDLDATLVRAVDLGGTAAQPRMPVPGVGWTAYVIDPDGNVFGLFQRDEAAT